MNSPHRAEDMKILIVNHRGDSVCGGVEQWLIRYARVCGQYGIALYVALPEHGPLEAALLEIGIPVKVIHVDWQPRTIRGSSIYLRGLQARVQELADWIVSEQIDLVHTNTLNLFEGALAAMRAGRPHIWHVRSTYGLDPEPYAFGGFELDMATQVTLLDTLADGILAVSAFPAREFTRHGVEVHVVSDGIDAEGYRSLAANYPDSDIRKELGLAPDVPLIANVSRVSREKGLPTYVAACRQILQVLPEVHFLIVGNHDEDRSATALVRDAITRMGLQSRIHLIGNRGDLPALYPQFDLVMLTSLHEGLSNVLKEALVFGVPVVATRCGGSEVLIEHDRHGLLCDVGDDHALAESAIRCLQDCEFSATLAQHGRCRIEQEFSLSGSLSRLAEYYKSVCTDFEPKQRAGRAMVANAMLSLACRHAELFLQAEPRKQFVHHSAPQTAMSMLLSRLRNLCGKVMKLMK